MNELAGVMGSAVMQALWEVMTQGSDAKPHAIDGCHALKSSGEPVRLYFPKRYRPGL